MSSKVSTDGQRYFFIREGGKYQRIDFDRIRYIEACKSYSRIDTAEKIWMVSGPIFEFEELLPPNEFCRFHRSYIVRIAQIEWFNNTHLRVAGKDLPIGLTYRERLRDSVLLLPGEPRQAQRTGKGMPTIC